MSTNRGIFDNFPTPPATRPDSPFEAYCEPAPALAARTDSPFTAADLEGQFRPVRKTEFPLEAGEPEGFGFEAPAPFLPGSPLEPTPQPAAGSSPFSIDRPRGPSPETQAAIAAFGGRPHSAVQVPQAFAQPPSEAGAPAPTPVADVAAGDAYSDSTSIRQLELRAIFGVDRELTSDEILDRCRALRGMRNVARVAPEDMATIDALRHLLPKLGFGSGSLKLYADSVPIEFIREASVILAVQTDGTFAPGVRETLILVARELDRLP